jgi:murein L,D-transpeptidase YafK
LLRLLSILLSLTLLGGCARTLSPLAENGHRADYITVDKSDRLLTLWEEGKPLRSYRIYSMGWDPVGHKVQEGDGRTPEGRYVIDGKHPSKRFQKFLNISYPNETDQANAFALGVSPGGFVGIHGDKGGEAGARDRKNPAWTEGCISVRNEAIEEIYQVVPLGTEIFIQP